MSVKITLAGLVCLGLAVPASAQFGPVPPAGRPGVPVFQVNPQLAQAAINQAVANQAAFAAAQPAAGGGAVLYNIPGLPNYGGVARLSSTPAARGGDPAWSNPGYTTADRFPVDPAPTTYPYYCPYYPFYDPAGGALRGLADLTSSYGRYQQDYQKGRLLNQEVERSKIETRIRLYEEWRYYQSLQPTAEDVRIASLERDLSRARRQPPASDVISAKSSNDLLAFLKTAQNGKGRPLVVPLDEDTLLRINVTTDHGGNIGLIKPLARQDGRVNWPLVLKTQAFNEVREKIDSTLRNAVDRVRANGRVDDALMFELKGLHQKLDETVEQNGGKLSLPEQILARRYVGWLGDALQALSDPNVANYFNRTYEARGKTVADLIDWMIKNGLKFAPALPGDEASYRTLYTLLAAYDNAMQMVSR